MLDYIQPLYRPPSEAGSLILQATIGCSHNRCAFCYMYKGKRFRAVPWEELRGTIEAAARLFPETRRIFLADGDAMALSISRLETILDCLAASFPYLQRVTAYANPANLLDKSVEEMKRLRDKKLAILYYGVESGHPELLRRIDKGAGPDEMVEGCLKAAEAGLKLSVTVILGLAGRKGSMEHAMETAALVNRIRPRYLSALTLMLGPFENDYRMLFGPDFEFNSPIDDIMELRGLVSALETDKCIFRSNHASNYLPLKGTLMKDREKLLGEIDRALARPSDHLKDESMRGL